MKFILHHGLIAISLKTVMKKQKASFWYENVLAFGRTLFFVLLLAVQPLTEIKAQTLSCKAECDQLIGGTNNHIEESWSNVSFFTKNIFDPHFDVDELSTYTAGSDQVTFVKESKNGRGDFGIGVDGPKGVLSFIKSQINYIGEENRSEKLLLDFGCNFTGAEVKLSRFYSRENGEMGETGGWRAFDEDFNLIAVGAFAANVPFKPNDPGLFMFRVRVGKPFRYLELVARPYVDRSKSTFADNSDYFVQSVIPTCQDIIESEAFLGDGDDFNSWNQAAVTFRPFDSEVEFPADENNFTLDTDDQDGGLGVGNDEDMRLNYCTEEGTSELIQIDLGAEFETFELTLTDLEPGEVGFWRTFRYDNDFNLIEVGSGTFEGQPGSSEKALFKDNEGSTTGGSGGFTSIQIGGGPLEIGKSKKGNKSTCGTPGFFVNRFIPDPTCLGATEVTSYKPGLTSGGEKLPAERTNLDNALLAPDFNDSPDSPINFVSLGFGGEITVKFFRPFVNGPGVDVQVIETSFEEDGKCSTHPETAEVFASQDGVNFVFLGNACRDDASFDLGPLSWAQYIKIIDTSNPEDFVEFGKFADGYDVDGVICLNGRADKTPDDGLIACTAQKVVDYRPGTRKDGKKISASRTKSKNALGEPDAQHNYSRNLAALGFGDGRQKGEEATTGVLTVRFDFVIFDETGNDIKIWEATSWEPIYGIFPETAEVYVSKTGEDWVFLGTTNTECELKIDTEVDFAGEIRWAQYVKLVDITDKKARRTDRQCNPTNYPAFNRASDGFDVDAITCADFEITTKAVSLEAQADEYTEHSFKAYPNPSEGYLRFDLSENPEQVLPENNLVRVYIRDFTGAKVATFEAELDNDFRVNMDMSAFEPGIYFLQVEVNDHIIKTDKFVKK